MGKYLIRYNQLEEVYYEDYIEADTLDEAVAKVKDGDVNFDNEVDSQ